jgi:surface antigen
VTSRSRLLAPLTSALVGGLVLGLLWCAPAAATAAPPIAAGRSAAAPDRHRTDPAETVFARSAYLCYGYQSCRDAGMPNAGYAQNNKSMYWRMYAGHNCTNYAAYRMVKSGLPNERPWSGGGNATYWGTSVPRLTDDTPRVGAVAWWKANTGPAGSAGHVAYVERVVSADQIVVSQDSWNGDFSWATITRGSGNWPSGFIHFNDLALVNRDAPVVAGVAKVGSVLTATAGSWKPGDATVTYQWFADGLPITDATAASLKLTRARLGQQVTVTTTASKLGYPSKAVSSAPTERIQPGALRNVTAPTITGEPKVDRTLTLDGGTWTPQATLAFQWFSDGRPISGATTRTLELGPDLAGSTITARVTGSRSGYDNVATTTAPSAPVAPGTIAVTRTPGISGTARIGQTLGVVPGAFRPTDAKVAVQWLRDGQPVLNATGPTYTVSELDLGARVAAQVTLTRAGYEPSVLRTPPSAAVLATPRLEVAREKLRHSVRLTVTLTSRYVADVTGTVTLRVQGGFRRELTLRDGVAHVRVRDLPKGKHALQVRYGGSSTLEAVRRTGAIWMP